MTKDFEYINWYTNHFYRNQYYFNIILPLWKKRRDEDRLQEAFLILFFFWMGGAINLGNLFLLGKTSGFLSRTQTLRRTSALNDIRG